MRRTGGGQSENLLAMFALDKRLVAVMGGQEFATGDSMLMVHPFPISVDRQPDLPTVIKVCEQDVETMPRIHMSPIPSTSRNDPVEAPSRIPAPTSPIESAMLRIYRRRSSNMNE